ncbi:hypothetical protein AAKU67_003660 [Oxalobacteraceae bacterium GrIS 2.11]
MTHTFGGIPTWIVGLFFGLLYYGYAQTKTRTVSRTRLTVFPVILVGLSLYGVLHVANSTVPALLAWAAGLRLAFYLNSHIPHGQGVVAQPDRQHFVLPGSWIPMLLIMTVFSAKFVLGYLVGSHMVDSESFNFIVLSSAISGLISGTFLARAVQIFKAGTFTATDLSLPNKTAT